MNTETLVKAIAVAHEIHSMDTAYCRANVVPEFLEEVDDTHGPYEAMIQTIAQRENVAIPIIWIGVYDWDSDDCPARIAVNSQNADSDFWATVDRELFRLCHAEY